MLDPQFAAFLVVATVMIVVPGADFTIVTRNALRSRRSGLATAIGVTCGLTLHGTLIVTGVATALMTVPSFRQVLQLVGGAYLLYLGARALSAALTAHPAGREHTTAEHGSDLESSHRQRTAASLRQGFLTDALNPKTIMLFLSLLPQFVDTEHPYAPRTSLLAGIIVLLGLCWFVAVTLLVDRLGHWLRRPRVVHAVDLCTGTVLTGFGTMLLLGRLG